MLDVGRTREIQKSLFFSGMLSKVMLADQESGRLLARYWAQQGQQYRDEQNVPRIVQPLDWNATKWPGKCYDPTEIADLFLGRFKKTLPGGLPHSKFWVYQHKETITELYNAVKGSGTNNQNAFSPVKRVLLSYISIPVKFQFCEATLANAAATFISALKTDTVIKYGICYG